MKKFFEKYSYESVRLFLNQFAISLLGLTLTLASSMMGSRPLAIITSVLSILFYLFLQYTVAWGVGANDKISIDCNHAKKDMKIPVLMWLLSNSINLIIAICFTVGYFFRHIEAFGNMVFVSRVAAFILEGEYNGVLSIKLVENWTLASLPVSYFLITLPSLAIVLIGYGLGLKGKGHLNFLGGSYPDSDAPEKKGFFGRK